MSSDLVKIDTIPSSVQNIVKTTTYHGFKVTVFSVDIFTSVTLKVNIAYLLNGELDKSEQNDGIYNYTSRFIVLTGDDYSQWSTDDQYLVDYVSNNIDKVMASTFKPRPNFLKLNGMHNM